MAITIADICRYPVKGLNAEHLERIALAPGQGLAHDRRFAIAHGGIRFDAPPTTSGGHFVTLLRHEKLAQIRAEFEPETGILTIKRAGKQVARAKATDPVGRTLLGEFFAGFLGRDEVGMPRFIEATDSALADSHPSHISIVNLASVHDLERVVRRPVDPLRFRANIYVEGAEAWSELGWIGGRVAIGGARLRVVEPIGRCAATNVDPQTAERDMNIPRALQHGFGHANLGVYAEVLAGGEIARGDTVTAPG